MTIQENAATVEPGMAADWEAAVAEVEASEETSDESTEETSEETSDETEEEVSDPSTLDVEEETEEEDDDASEATPEKAAEKELDQLKKLAEKHGFKLDDKGITKRDVAAFADKKRRLTSQFTAERNKLHADVAAYRSQLEEAATPYLEFREALNGKDPDAIAKAMGFEDWNTLQGDYLKTLTDPSHQKMKELQKRLDDEKAEKERLARYQEAERQNRERSQAVINYKLKLSKQAQESDDPLAKAMFDDRLFVDTVFSVQKDSVDPLTGRTITLEEALDVPLPNGKTLRQNLQLHYQKLISAFGAPKAPLEHDPARGQKAPQKKVEATTPAKKPLKKKAEREMSETELMNLFAKRMKDAAG